MSQADAPAVTNGELAELLARAAQEETTHRRRALDRAARAAYYWAEEAWDLATAGRSLTELRAVGPWVAAAIHRWLEDPPDELGEEIPELRRGFLTLAEARATLAAAPDWLPGLRGDLQMHTTESDGKNTLREMVAAAVDQYRYRFVAITDHSKGLPIAGGMDEPGFARQGMAIDELNGELSSAGIDMRVLKGIEMNLGLDGEGDMEPDALARLDIVLGAFHSKLRRMEDQTERCLGAMRNPTVHVLAHPAGRRFNVRLGVRADWPRVFDAATRAGKALEIDAHPDRQDLSVPMLERARDFDVWISIGTDAHSIGELRYMEFGLAAAIRAGIPRERILNFLTADEVVEWARTMPDRAMA